MSPKKQSSKKLDLSSLGRLTHDVISESDKLGATKEKFSLSSTESISTNSPVIEELANSPVDKPSVDTSQLKSKSQRTEVELPKGLVEATNSAGEVLKPGDTAYSRFMKYSSSNWQTSFVDAQDLLSRVQ